MFEGQSVQELKKAFHDAVDDYLATCEKMGREFNKTFKGSLNVRIGRELHVKAYRVALKKGIPLNQLVSTALEHEVSQT